MAGRVIASNYNNSFSCTAAVRVRGVLGEEEITLFTCGAYESQEHEPPLSKGTW